MPVPHRSRLNRIAVVASGAMLWFGGIASAQTVRVFDDAPSVEQLRNILAPESSPSHSRSIVIMRSDGRASPMAVQQASVQMPSGGQADSGSMPSQPVARASANVSAPAARPASRHESDTGAVAFHINFAFNSRFRINESQFA